MILLTPPSPPRTNFPHDSANESREHSLYRTGAKQSSNFHVEDLHHIQRKASQDMTTPHRGLEHGLPPGMILPDPLRGPQPHSSSHATAPPKSAHGYEQEESARSWQLQLKAEEDKRRQEEEKRRQEEQRTRQEELRLEQRRVEQEMLRESIGRGIHPNLVPLIFVGLGAGNVAGAGFEMAQQYIAQFQQVGLQVQNTLQQNSTSDGRRESRVPGVAQYGAIQQPTPQALHQIPGAGAGLQSAAQSQQAQQAANVYPSPAYQSPHSQSKGLVPGSSRFAPPSAATKTPIQSALPRLTTNEAQVQHAPPGTAPSYASKQYPQNPLSSQPQERTSPSPSIYFHHWQPPATQTSTPSGKDSQKTSPKNSGNLGSADPSPRKRKAQGAHQPAPHPTSAPNQSSPTFSTVSSTGSRHPAPQRGSPESKTEHDHNEDISSKHQRSDSRDAGAEMTKSPPLDPPTSSELQSSKESDSKLST